MLSDQDRLSATSGDTLSLPQTQNTRSHRQSWHGLRQASPAQVRKLGFTRRHKERRGFKEDENPEERHKRHREEELKPLYKELLYTIAHRLGKPVINKKTDSSQLHHYIQEAFSMTEEEHKELLNSVQYKKQPVYCLMVTVKEAKDILGKDISGYSDPYCLLTIMHNAKEGKPKATSLKPLKAVVKGNVPAKNIYQTDVKKQTLNPIWNQTFIMEFDELAGSNFHMEMWDKDEEVSLGQKLEEIRTNLHGLRRMLKDAKKEKGQDDFLGNIVLKLEDLHCVEDCWYLIEPRTETYPNRGKCHLQLKFVHKERDETLSAGRSAYASYCGILQQFVQSHISKQQGSGIWKGELCEEGQMLLEYYATQNDLSPFLQDLAKWVAYSKLYQTLELDPTVLFKQLTSIEYHWDQQQLPYQQKQELGDSLHGFLQYGLCLVSKYRDIFPPTPSATPRLQTLLRVLVQICKTRAFQKLNPAQFDLHDEVIDAVQVGTQEWFNIKKGLHQPMTKDITERVRALSCLIQEVQEDVQLSKDVWNKVFVSAVQLDMFTVVYYELDLLLAAEVRGTLGEMEDQMEPALANSLFPLYLSLKAIHKDKAFLQKRGKMLELTDFQECFRDALPYWLKKAYNTTLERVQRAVQIDELQPMQLGTVPVKHSSSAVDLVACLQPVCRLWEELAWPDAEEGFMLMVKLTEDICKIAVTFCELLKQRVKKLSENSDPGTAVNMLCVVVNDLEYVRTVLTRLPQQLNWAGLRERTNHVIKEAQFNNTLPSQLQHTQGVLTREIRSALVTLGKQLRSDIEKHVLNMASRRRLSVRSTEDAVLPLMRYLEKELQYMNENLVQENFNSLLAPLWVNSVQILDQVSKNQSGVMEFYQRLHYTLQCLEQCFHAEGNGLSLETLHSAEFKTLKAHLVQNSLSTQQLIEKFLERKVYEQKTYSSENYGAVTLITSYKRSDQKLHIEVLNAVNLIPMDSNGFSDPFVQLSLEPRHLFHEVESRRTQIKTRDLNPLFEESFEFLVSLEQCNAAGACLMVTVLDHDTISSDDFEGEAFLSLRAVPGVGGTATSPAQIRLPLMHPKPNDDSILQLLEARKADREAQAFVKLRRQKEKMSQEE
ncbi:LOW QUALITY PROTEIN: protein unc-13 homolog D [Scleropages formosus]|uniref:LOW QUALITY PROTEIN: protein unc-13 homolog D n=1 Tax=Scleropages formosus TaxID=113540 RepID=UPI0010FAAB09|nr:LOW QUALITY PROTEIN: protein unc-13 homolog D [Scleropages formosus]